MYVNEAGIFFGVDTEYSHFVTYIIFHPQTYSWDKNTAKVGKFIGMCLEGRDGKTDMVIGLI